MKYTTMSEIQFLQTVISNRRDRVRNLAAMLRAGVSKRDLDWIRAEIAEHEAYCARMEQKVKAFFAPAA